MGSFLLFLLFLLLLGILAIVTVVRSLIYGTGLDRLFKFLRRQMDLQGTVGDTSHNSARNQNRQTKTSSGETIIDQRTPQEANRKIFDDNEGEYVDYKED